MSSTGFLLLVIGIFLAANVLNGNISKVAKGEATLSFLPSGKGG